MAMTLAPKTDIVHQFRQESAGQGVHAAFQFDHVGVVMPGLLTKQFQEGRIHERLLVHQQAEHLDHALRPPVPLQEFADRVFVITGDDLLPGGLAFLFQQV